MMYILGMSKAEFEYECKKSYELSQRQEEDSSLFLLTSGKAAALATKHGKDQVENRKLILDLLYLRCPEGI